MEPKVPRKSLQVGIQLRRWSYTAEYDTVDDLKCRNMTPRMILVLVWIQLHKWSYMEIQLRWRSYTVKYDAADDLTLRNKTLQMILYRGIRLCRWSYTAQIGSHGWSDIAEYLFVDDFTSYPAKNYSVESVHGRIRFWGWSYVHHKRRLLRWSYSTHYFTWNVMTPQMMLTGWDFAVESFTKESNWIIIPALIRNHVGIWGI